MAGSRARNRDARPAPPPRAFTAVYLAAIVVAVAVCYARLAGYFFAQDDFILLERATFQPGAAVFDFFAREPGHFRPLTKGACFVVLHRLFGLNAMPYHVVSLVLHALNALLIWRALRRLRVGDLAALTGAALFAMSAAFFHVLAWVSCIQQLVGATFMLLALDQGIAHLDARRAHARWLSLTAYALALASLEQTAALPLALGAVALLGVGDRERIGWRAARSALWPHAALMLAYAGFILLWKTLPGEGDYDFRAGANVWRNLVTYLGWSLDVHMTMPMEMAVPVPAFRVSHGVLVALLGYHLARRRWPEVVLGLGFCLAGLAPVLFLENHTFYLHTYVPALGVIYLLARAIDDIFSFAGHRHAELPYSLACLAFVGLAALCFTDARRNERIQRDDGSGYLRSFVVRRAIAAQNVRDSLREQRDPRRNADAVYLVYARPTHEVEQSAWNALNVQAALGYGSELRLIYGNPDLYVRFMYVDELGATARNPRTDIFFHDDVGHLRTHIGL